MPVFLNRRWASRASAITADTGALSIQECSRCGFVWNSSFEPERVVYDQAYENDQTHSDAFRKHLTEIADRTIAVAAGRPFHLLEVGCGQGVFLHQLARRAGALLLSATGYDPTFRGGSSAPGDKITIIREYFNRNTAALMPAQPTVVVTRHTIEHVPEPVQFLSSVRDAIDGEAAILIETPDVDWILSRGEFQDLFYEHCSLFTGDSLAQAMVHAGWRPTSVDRVFGQQYLFALGTSSQSGKEQTPEPRKIKEHNNLDLNKFVDHWKSVIRSAKQPAALWGAGAKGVTFAMLMDPEAEFIKAVVDINPEKQGHYLPKTGLPIISPKTAVERGIQTVIAMNPNYTAEIVTELATLNSSATVIAVIGGDLR